MSEESNTVNVTKTASPGPTTTPKAVPTSTPKPEPKPEPTPRVADYGLLKAKNLVETLLETEGLPSKADCNSLLEIKAEDDSPLYYTQVMVKGMLGGASTPNKKQLDKLAKLIEDAS